MVQVQKSINRSDLLSFINFSWILNFINSNFILSMHEYSMVGFDGFWWVLVGFDGFWWVLVGFDGFWYFYICEELRILSLFRFFTVGNWMNCRRSWALYWRGMTRWRNECHSRRRNWRKRPRCLRRRPRIWWCGWNPFGITGWNWCPVWQSISWWTTDSSNWRTASPTSTSFSNRFKSF